MGDFVGTDWNLLSVIKADLKMAALTEICPSRRSERFKAPC